MPPKKRKQNKKRTKNVSPFQANHLTPVSDLDLPSDGKIWLVCGYDQFLGKRKQLAGPFTEQEAEKEMKRIKANEATAPDYDRILDIRLERAIFIPRNRSREVLPMTDEQIEESNRRCEEYRERKRAWEKNRPKEK